MGDLPDAAAAAYPDQDAVVEGDWRRKGDLATIDEDGEDIIRTIHAAVTAR